MQTTGTIKPAVATELTWDAVKGFVESPLTQLPTEFQLPTWDFWSFFAHLLPDQLALASRIRFWIAEDGLTLAELKEAFSMMRIAKNCREINFANQVLAGIGDSIEKVRDALRRAERGRRRAEEAAAREVPPEKRIATDLAAHFAAGIGKDAT